MKSVCQNGWPSSVITVPPLVQELRSPKCFCSSQSPGPNAMIITCPKCNKRDDVPDTLDSYTCSHCGIAIYVAETHQSTEGGAADTPSLPITISQSAGPLATPDGVTGIPPNPGQISPSTSAGRRRLADFGLAVQERSRYEHAGEFAGTLSESCVRREQPSLVTPEFDFSRKEGATM